MPKGIRETRLYERNQVIAGPFLTDDGVIVGAPRISMMKLDRLTLTERLWETASPSTWLVDVVDEVLLGARSNGADGHFTTDGRLAWASDGSRFVGVAHSSVTIVSGTDIEIRDPRSGEVEKTVKLPWRAEGSARACDSGLLVRAAPQDPMAVTAEEQRLCLVRADTQTIVWDRTVGLDCDRYLPAKHQSESQRVLQPVYSEGEILIVRYGSALFRLDPATGEIVWQLPVRLDSPELTVLEDRAYVPRWHGLTIVDIQSADVLRDDEPPELRSVSHPRRGVIRGDRIAFPCESGHIVVYDLSGNVVNIRKANARFWQGVEADGRLILAGSGALVVCDESIWAA